MLEMRRRDVGQPPPRGALLQGSAADAWGSPCWMSNSSPPDAPRPSGGLAWGDPGPGPSHRSPEPHARRSFAATVPLGRWAPPAQEKGGGWPGRRPPPPPRNSIFDEDGELGREAFGGGRPGGGLFSPDAQGPPAWRSSLGSGLGGEGSGGGGHACDFGSLRRRPDRQVGGDRRVANRGGMEQRIAEVRAGDYGGEGSVENRLVVGHFNDPSRMAVSEYSSIDPRKSVAALKKSKEYLEYIRLNGENPDEMEARLKVYQDLRKWDAELFRRCLEEPNPEEWVSANCPLSLLLSDYLVFVLGTAAVVAYHWCTGSNGLSWFPLLAWALVQIIPWCFSTTAVCWGGQCYWVAGRHEHLAPVWRVVCARILELLFVASTLGLGAFWSLKLKIWGPKGQSVAENWLDVHIIQELRGPVVVS
ncbi:unnamed protein product [Ostreobium quekettii]|uniref:Uncharacterized protein n=1 Tax=Ostreobium quekettii TaxID=121088 RepID=A0A8S1JFS6_9CHLO|nr:unnamed protein product [Ostreobium quekettii]|eukprot:evm.model.scf_328.6 EVM.evm.TU.scf_328.6   scf_328:56310-59949(+)